jgi:hypothetical protein
MYCGVVVRARSRRLPAAALHAAWSHSERAHTFSNGFPAFSSGLS